MATETDLRAIEMRLLEEVINRGDMDVFDELIAPDWTGEGDGVTGNRWDRERLRQALTAWRTAFPDFHGTITHLVADGDLCAARMVAEGTHTGPYFDLDPTGMRVRGTQIFFDRIVDGRVVASWIESGSRGFYQQISGRPLPIEAIRALTT